MSSLSSGAFANFTGKRLGQFIEELIRQAGYTYVKPQIFLRGAVAPVYTKECVVGADLYGKDHKADFVLYHPTKWPQCLVIESKWQQSGGSVDEKYPFLVFSIKKIQKPSIIVLDGKGYKPEARLWLEREVDGKILLHVLDMAAFLTFANAGGLAP